MAFMWRYFGLSCLSDAIAEAENRDCIYSYETLTVVGLNGVSSVCQCPLFFSTSRI